MKHNKISLYVCSFILISTSFNTFGVSNGFPGTSTTFIPPYYADYCQNEIMATEFLAPAMVNIDMTETVLENVLYTPLMNTLSTMMGQTITSNSSSMTSLSDELIRIKKSESNKKLEIKSLITKSHTDQINNLNTIVESDSNKLFKKNLDSDDGATDKEKDYFRKLCTNNKIKEIAQGPDARFKVSAKVSFSMDKDAIRQNSISSAESEAMNRIEDRLKTYCSASNFQSGICEEVSLIPNGDVLARVMLNPQGQSDPDSLLGNTHFTYNDTEAKVTGDFINNIIGVYPISSPTNQEKQDSKKQKFISMYKNAISLLSLSRFSFEIAKQNRTRTISSDIKSLSYLDATDYLINSSGVSGENKSKTTSIKTQIYNVLTINNKLQLELYSQNERIQLLEAGLLSAKENNATTIKYINSKR